MIIAKKKMKIINIFVQQANWDLGNVIIKQVKLNLNLFAIIFAVNVRNVVAVVNAVNAASAAKNHN